ncbi:hypothetical protein OH77DRAFT_1590079 [Trametes cingulata]|nr:hypothetical protein OH77DRAFT_1590079 [Trametes cingulata]
MDPALILVKELRSTNHPAPHTSTIKKYALLAAPPKPLEIGLLVSLRSPTPHRTIEQALADPSGASLPLAVVGRIVGERATRKGEIELVVRNEAPNPTVKWAHLHVHPPLDPPGVFGITNELTRRLEALNPDRQVRQTDGEEQRLPPSGGAGGSGPAFPTTWTPKMMTEWATSSAFPQAPTRWITHEAPPKKTHHETVDECGGVAAPPDVQFTPVHTPANFSPEGLPAWPRAPSPVYSAVAAGERRTKWESALPTSLQRAAYRRSGKQG